MATAIINHQSLHICTYGDMAAWSKGEEALGPPSLVTAAASCHHPHKADASSIKRAAAGLMESWPLATISCLMVERWREPIFI